MTDRNRNDASIVRMKLIDTHCHLVAGDFERDRDNVIKRAEENSIVMISSATKSSDYISNMELANSYTSVYATLGLDPLLHHEIKQSSELIKKSVNNIVAIGETGLDFYLEREHSQRDNQKEAFIEMIILAAELRLPIQIHSRSAGAAALRILNQNNAENVHLHAFDGKASLARNASSELGYYFSIPTSVVRSPQKRKLVKAVDIEHLLLETDSPVLGAERDTRNEPANLPIALREVASILHRDEQEIREIVLENTLRLYSRIKIS
jgi:TatD DNase family protein